MALEYARAIEPYRLLFLEDPVQPTNLEGLRRIGRHTAVPIAIGEALHTKYAFEQVVRDRLASYVRPDVILTGGITETRKIAAMAEAAHLDVALHVAPTPVSNLAAAHVAASCPACTISEISADPTTRQPWVQDLFMGGNVTVKDGYANCPNGRAWAATWTRRWRPGSRTSPTTRRAWSSRTVRSRTGKRNSGPGRATAGK